MYVDIYFILHASSDSYTNIICSLAQAAAVVQEDADNTGDETTRSRKKRKKRASTHLATKTVLDKYYNVLDLFYSLLECSGGGKIDTHITSMISCSSMSAMSSGLLRLVDSQRCNR